MNFDESQLLSKAKELTRHVGGPNGHQFRFHPWCPPGYSRGFKGQRVLVLGESTYYYGDDFETQYKKWGTAWFSWTILDYYNGTRCREYTFWTKWINALLNRPASKDEAKTVLDSVAFYNYGDVVLKGPGQPIPMMSDLALADKYTAVIAELAAFTYRGFVTRASKLPSSSPQKLTCGSSV